jgi:hypothetical protein
MWCVSKLDLSFFSVSWYNADRGGASMNTQVYTHQELKNMIRPIIQRYNATDAWLFGSYARNEATPDSDIDLIVIGGGNFILTNVFAIAEDLFEASGKNVDVYELRELKVGSPIYNNVMAERVSLQ